MRYGSNSAEINHLLDGIECLIMHRSAYRRMYANDMGKGHARSLKSAPECKWRLACVVRNTVKAVGGVITSLEHGNDHSVLNRIVAEIRGQRSNEILVALIKLIQRR